MLTPPTDRLHKFLAIAGVALFLIGVTYPIDKYHTAEIHRIVAFEKVQSFAFAYGRFAEKVNTQRDIYNSAIEKGLAREKFEPEAKRIREIEPDVKRLDSEVQNILVQSQKQVALMQHYYFIRNLWFFIGACCVLVGSFLAYLGFKQWLSQPKEER